MYTCKTCIILAIILLPLFCIGQSIDQWVIGSGGETSISNRTQLDWTLGETFVSSIVTRQGMITEGFHQPNIVVMRIEDQDLPVSKSINVFPNPTSSNLVVDFGQVFDQEQEYLLFDMDGKIVDKGNLGSGQTHVIDVQQLVPGTYVLRISQKGSSDKQAEVQQFQIIKQ